MRYVSLIAILSSIVLATACSRAVVNGSVSGTSMEDSGTQPEKTLDHIEIDPFDPTSPPGVVWQFQAIAVYTDQTSADVTNLATWASSAPAVAAFDNSSIPGSLKCEQAGNSTVEATYRGQVAWTTMNVTAAHLLSIEVSPGLDTIPLGSELQLSATGTYDDSTTADLTSTVAWNSQSPSVVTVSDASGTQGLAVPRAPGSATLTASLNGVSGSASVTVSAATLTSIAITPVAPAIASGLAQQFYATGTYSDGSTQDLTASSTWASSNTAVATISNAQGSAGLANALATGVSTISAMVGSTLGQATINVTSAVLQSLAVLPLNPTVADGYGLQFTATGTYSDGSTQDLTNQVLWSSSDPATAIGSNASGTQGWYISVAPGSTVVRAVVDGVHGQTDLTVSSATLQSLSINPSTPSCAAGVSQLLSVTASYSDGSTQDVSNQVSWGSSDPTLATISNATGSKGLLACLSVGPVLLTASLQDQQAQVDVNVSSATLVSIAVTPNSPSFAQGLTQQLTATGTYTDASTHDLTSYVTWSSSNASFAPVSNAILLHGLVTGLAQGTATITAALGLVSGATAVTVTAPQLVSIALTPPSQSVAQGLSQQYAAIGTYTDHSLHDVTSSVAWATGSNSVATISNTSGSKGLLSAVAIGTTTVQGSLSGVSGQASVTVSSPSLLSITLTSASNSVAAGLSAQFTATGHYSDGSTQNLSSSVSWSSSSNLIATLSASGLLMGIAIGTPSVTATLGSVSSSPLSISVLAPVLQSITVTPGTVNLVEGLLQQFTATGHYSDGSTQNLTSSVTWASANLLVATISNLLGTQGQASGIGLGSASITATMGSLSGSATISGIL